MLCKIKIQNQNQNQIPLLDKKENSKSNKTNPTAISISQTSLPSKNRPEVLAEHLKKLTSEARTKKSLQDDPKQFLSENLRKIVNNLFENPQLLEKEAKKGKSEIIILKLVPFLEEEKQKLGNLTLDQLILLFREVIQKPQKDLEAKGFQLSLRSLWFENYITLSWKSNLS